MAITPRGTVSQYEVVCISFSGIFSSPAPTFSFVWNLIFLKPTTCDVTWTSPWFFTARPAGSEQEAVEDADLGGDDRVRVVVDLGLAHVRAPLLVVVLLDEVRAALQDVDRLLVHHRRRAVVVDLGDDARLARHVLHHEVVGRHAAQADRVRRVALARPVEAAARAVQQALLLQELQDLRQVLAAERLARVERQLEGRALHVVDQDLQVVRVDAPLLDRANRRSSRGSWR